MKGILKGYLLYLIGAAAVVGYAYWQYSRQTGESMLGPLIRARAARNGHVDSETYVEA